MKLILFEKKEGYDIQSPEKTLEVAKVLTRYIKDNGLAVNIKGNDYVKAEGWQFAGSQLGIIPVIEEVTDLSNEKELKYKTVVKLKRLDTNQIVGCGIAICSNKEHSKKSFDEYAICSMSQTRAIGKAYRNLLAWLITAAGFSPTPAEEMDFKSETPKQAPTPTKAKKPQETPQSEPQAEFVMDILDQINECNSIIKLEGLYKSLNKQQSEAEHIITAFTERKKALLTT